MPWNKITLSCLCLLLSSCAVLQHQTAVETVFTEPETDALHIKVKDFSMFGRVSIQNAHQHYSGSIRWQHTKLNDNILLLSPLGQAVAEIWQDHQGARLTTSKQEVFHAADIENLTQEVLGWRLPINGLQFWIQGYHSPFTIAAKDINSQGQLIAMRQDDWYIRYLSFFPKQLEQTTRPRVLELNYQDLKIKVVVDNWQIE